MTSSLDSNIIIYSFDERDLRKQSIALDLVSHSMMRKAKLATQVCGEVFRRLSAPTGLSVGNPWFALETLMSSHDLIHADATVFKRAMQLAHETRRQFWDCLVIATCAAQDIKRLYTEDTGAEPHTVMGVELVNPFLMEDWDEAFAIR
jgi:predicted nucleic acid-binding protein